MRVLLALLVLAMPLAAAHPTDAGCFGTACAYDRASGSCPSGGYGLTGVVVDLGGLDVGATGYETCYQTAAGRAARYQEVGAGHRYTGGALLPATSTFVGYWTYSEAGGASMCFYEASIVVDGEWMGARLPCGTPPPHPAWGSVLP